MEDTTQFDSFESAKTLLINTGNVVTWNRLHTVNAQKPEQELLQCLKLTLQYFKNNLTDAEKNKLKSTENVEVHKEDYREKFNDDHRSELQFTVKVFLTDFDPDALRHAINILLSELNAHYIDSLIVSFPSSSGDEAAEGEFHSSSSMRLDQIKPVWSLMEDYNRRRKVTVLGVSDFAKDAMEGLFDWAQVKPSTDQVNLASCCVMPQDLVEYAKDNSIQLLTHHDPPRILVDSVLCDTLSSCLGSEAALGWSVWWSVRYTALVKSRSVIQNKGYMIAARRPTAT